VLYKSACTFYLLTYLLQNQELATQTLGWHSSQGSV